MNVLIALSLAINGILAGIYLSVWIHDHRINDLSATEYTAMHQMRDKTFARVMPPVVLTNLGLLLLTTLFALPPGLPRFLGGIAFLLAAAETVLTITLQLPINARVQSWTPETIPSDWTATRDRWARHHLIRTLADLASYTCLLIAITVMLAGASR